MNRIWKLSLLMTFLIIVDQLTKGAVQSSFSYGESIPIVDGFFNLTYVKNPGAAFGFGAGASLGIRKFLFLLLPVLACFWLIWLIWDNRNKSLFSALTYSLILSGAIGNLIDRFTLGYVVDFLDFYVGQSHFPAFNIADSCISVGAAFLIWEFILELKNKKRDEA